MPKHFNSVTLIGNLTRDPELRYTNNDTPVCDMGLAVNRRYKANGEWQDDAVFTDVTTWNNQAEKVEKYLSKGDPCMVDGRLSHDTWKNDSGEKQSKLYVTANNVIFLHSGDSDSEAVESDDYDETYDDIPF